MADTDFVAIMTDLRNAPWREHAEHVGVITVLWSRLELYTDVFLVRMMNIECETTASAVITTMDFREKLNALKIIGFQRKPSKAWFEELRKTIDYIDNDLRNQRNRYVHDYWLASSDKVAHVQHKTKLVRPQAREFAIQYHSASETSIGQLMAFQVSVLADTGRLMDLLARYNSAQETLPEKPGE